MAKEWDKFSADYKKLKSQSAGLTKQAGAAEVKRMQVANSNVSEGEGNLKTSLTKARKGGVTGDSVGDFMKNKDFQEAMKLLNKAVDMLEEGVKAVNDFADKADAAADALAGLHADIGKDLKKRKDSSESKKDIQALEATTEADAKEFRSLARNTRERVVPAYRDYGKKFQATVAKIVKEAPDVVAKEVEGKEIPQKLVDRVLNTAFTKCAAGAKDVKTMCDTAMTKATRGDNAGALAELKKAVLRRKDITVIAEDYAKIVKDFKDVVQGTKDAKKILDTVAKMAQFDTVSERAIRGLSTTIKKAG